jgi:phosphoglycerate kinase
MNLRPVSEVLPESRVILRMDVDVSIKDGVVVDNSRLKKSISTIKILLAKNCKIAVIGDMGRPTGPDPKMSLKPVYLELMSMLEAEENLVENIFVEDVNNRERLDLSLARNQIVFLENLRFWKGENDNDPEFLKDLKEMCQFFVNDAFAKAHRVQRSTMLFKEMPSFYGVDFVEEATKIGQIVEHPEHPLTIVLGGAKEDKLSYVDDLQKIADKVLIGGKLPKLNPQLNNCVVAKLRDDGLDLSDEDIKIFVEQINSSKMIIWAGALGFFEDPNCRKGTEEIAKAIANSPAFKIVAGGDTETSIRDLGLWNKIDLVCSGGGVMLEFLAKGKLPTWN